MKKIFLFLSILVSFFSYGQAEFPEGVQITGGQPTNTTPTFLTTTSPTGVQEKIPSAYIEKTANKTSTITGYDTTLYPNEKAAHDALNLKLNISDLPTNLTLYPTNVASDVSGYVKMVTDIHAPDYNTVAVDVSTPAITGTGQLVSQRITDAGVLIGQPGVFNVTTFGNIRRLSGSGTATFYFEVYHRDALGVETLICTSSISNAVVNGTYAEFTASGVWDDGEFSATDRIVIKSYANRIVGGSDPVYQFQFGGATPVRTLLPVPFSVVDAGYELKANKSSVYTTDAEKYYSSTYINGVLPTTYSKVVYVNATSPTTATIFDLNNPPTTNDNSLKNDTANIYIGTDASTWVYKTGTGYVTKTISSTTSNFYIKGTTTDAGNSKTAFITRSGKVDLGASPPSTYSHTLGVDGAIEVNGVIYSNVGLQIGNGSGIFSGANLGDIKYRTNSSSSTTGYNHEFTTLNPIELSTGTKSFIGTPYIFSPTSGTGVYNGFNINPIINQTGGANGITRGLYINPTLTSAFDFRAIEVVAGKVIIPNGVNTNEAVNKGQLDGKITQTITNGVTDKSPSEDVIYDAFQNYSKIILKNTTTSTPVTGTLSQTILFSQLIPANTFKNGDFFNIILSRVGKVGTAGTLTQTIRINTSNTLTGATIIASNTGTTANLNHIIGRRFSIEGTSLKGFAGGSAPSDMINSSAEITSYTFDPTVDNYIFEVGQLSNTGDSMFHSSFILTN